MTGPKLKTSRKKSFNEETFISTQYNTFKFVTTSQNLDL